MGNHAFFRQELEKINITDHQIKNQEPEFLIWKIEHVIDLFKHEIIKNRNIFFQEDNRYKADLNAIKPERGALLPHAKKWKHFRQEMEIIFGQWSYAFNKILRKRIAVTDKIKTAEKLAEVKKLNLVFLFWTKQKDLILTFNTARLLSIAVKLSHLQEEIEKIKQVISEVKIENYKAAALYYLKKEKE